MSHEVSLLPANSVTVIRGSSKTIEVEVLNGSGKPVDLTGSKMYLTVKQAVTDTLPLILKTTDFPSQAELVAPRQGRARFYISYNDTRGLQARQYVFDIWAVLADGKRYSVISPTIFDVQAGVTVLAP